MRRNVVLSVYNRATSLDQTKPKVSFVRKIYHMSKHFCVYVGMCACDRMSLLKGPATKVHFLLKLVASYCKKKPAF